MHVIAQFTKLLCLFFVVELADNRINVVDMQSRIPIATAPFAPIHQTRDTSAPAVLANQTTIASATNIFPMQDVEPADLDPSLRTIAWEKCESVDSHALRRL